MKIQQIANTSINTRGNRQNNSVKFSGINMTEQSKSMPAFKARMPEVPLNKAKTLSQEVGGLFSDICNWIKRSYQKSELKRVVVEPFSKKLDKLAEKSPRLVQAGKGAAAVTACVGVVDYTAHNLNLEI